MRFTGVRPNNSMPSIARQPLVFLSYNAVDRVEAMAIKDALKHAAVAVNGADTVVAHADRSRELRRQLLEADAVVAVDLSDQQGAPSVAFEVGAALAANKPVFAVVADSSVRIPLIFTQARVFTVSHVEQMIRQLQLLANAAAAS